MGNITLNQLSEELSQLNSEIDLTEQRIEAIQMELDQTEEQIKLIEEKRIEEMRSQIDAARKTLADKKLVLKERQQLLQSHEDYLHSLEKPEWQNSTLASLDNIDLAKILKELQQSISNTKLKLTSNNYLDKDSFEGVVATVKNRTANDKSFAKEFLDYFGQILSKEQKIILLDIQPSFSQ